MMRRVSAIAALACIAGSAGTARGADCISLKSDDVSGLACRVTSAGPVAGSDGALSYQVQDYRDGDVVMAGGVAILASSDLRLVVQAAAVDAGFRTPTQFSTRFGTFLDLGAETHGTGQFPLGSLFRHDGAAWTKIDVETWQNDLSKRLPKGMSVWRGPFPDYPHFAAAAVVRQEPPASGADPDKDYDGYAAIRLTVSGNALAVERAAWKIGSDDPCAVMTDYPGCDKPAAK
jgi:hypothetical protein